MQAFLCLIFFAQFMMNLAKLSTTKLSVTKLSATRSGGSANRLAMIRTKQKMILG
jgi:hypothetical protein